MYGALAVLGFVSLRRREGLTAPVSTSFVGSPSNATKTETHAVYRSKHSKGGAFSRDVSWLLSPEDFFHRLETDAVQTSCRKMVWLGGESCNEKTDGGKLVCLDPDVVLPQKDCVIYSFGIGNDTSFDHEAAGFGCQVYMMDPTISPNRTDLISDNPKFLPIGLSNSSYFLQLMTEGSGNDTGPTASDPLTILAYEDVHKSTHHGGPVHYLKMDIEGHEWKALTHIMENNYLEGTLQIMVELHFLWFAQLSFDEAVLHLRKRWLFIEQLEDHGFLRVAYLPTRSGYTVYKIPGTNRTLEACGELFLVRRQMLEK